MDLPPTSVVLQPGERPYPLAPPHIQYLCLQCQIPAPMCDCLRVHLVRSTPVCGRCTCTGGEVVLIEEDAS